MLEEDLRLKGFAHRTHRTYDGGIVTVGLPFSGRGARAAEGLRVRIADFTRSLSVTFRYNPEGPWLTLTFQQKIPIF